MGIASARDALYIDYSLSYGHQGTMPCRPYHRKAAGPVGSPVNEVMSFMMTEQSPFALLVALSMCCCPMVRGSDTVDTLSKRLTYAILCCEATPKSEPKLMQANDEPVVPPLSWIALKCT